ncbi:type II secretion system F family protein [Tundrisphaera sp. TA3]|uniref:type II secretion system F family protein n=1 Tax=Tundrisphaera sp. TA3 TaxID=3435775 RepID=UPI003EB7EAE7
MADKAEEGQGDRGSASTRDAVELAEHLATLARSGLPLPAGLRAVGDEIDAGPLRTILRGTADRLDRGEGLGEALAIEGTRFPKPVRALVEAGVRSGRLADLLAEFVRHANLGRELRQETWAAVAYPLFLLAALMAILGVACRLSSAALGGLVNMVRDFGLQMPAQNVLVLGIARWVSEWGPTALIIAIGLLTSGGIAIRLVMPPAARRQWTTRIPLIGPVLRFSAVAEFCHMLALLVDAGVPLPEALRMAGASVHDADLADHCGRMAREVESGRPLADAVRVWPAIPAGLGQVFRWGEGRGALPEALHLAGDLFEARARSQASYANGAFLAILLLLIANGLGFAVLLLFHPIQLISRLSGGITLLF